MMPEELCFQLSNRKIGALAWGDRDAPVVLALHGWLDNAASFFRLAPRLSEYRVIALDLAGHGRSDWVEGAQGYPITQYLSDLRELVSQLALHRFRLLGHSLGAGVASLYAGCWPEEITHLGLIENLGSAVDSEEAFSIGVREYIDSNLHKPVESASRPFETWVRSRMKSQFPVPREAAEQLMTRALSELDSGEFILRSDPRLRNRTPRLTEGQVKSVLREISAPVLLIRGEQGLRRELTQVRTNYVKTIEVVEIPGGHHLHLEEGPDREIAKRLNHFYA